MSDIAAPPVEGDPPVVAAWTRHPGDVIRLLLSLVAVLAAGLLLEWGPKTAAGLQTDIEAIPALPKLVLLIVYATYLVLLVGAPVLLLVWVVTRRRWRLFGLFVVSTAAAAVLFGLVGDWVVRRVPQPSTGTDAVDATVAGWDFPGLGWVAAYAAGLTVTRAWIGTRWYRLGWAVLLLLPVVRLLVDAGAPTGRIFALAVGWAIGCAVLVALGRPSQAPTARMIAQGLAGAGVAVTALHRASVDARGSTPYFARAADGSGLFVKVLGRDERDADLLFRVYRYLRLRDVGDEAPFSTLRRAVEHEAMASVWAERAGVRTPRMRACVALADRSMALVYEQIAGRSLDVVPAEEITDDFLRAMWEQVALLREGQIAHRDLRRANVFDTDSGLPMIIDFGFAEVSASDELLDADVAQLVLSTAVDVGPQRAVAAAVAVLGPVAVARATPRMQSPALSGATRVALAHHKGLLAATRDEVQEQTGVPGVELAKLERISPKRLVMVVISALLLWVLIPQLTDLPRMLDQLRSADWWVAGLAVLVGLLTFPGEALTLVASVRQRIPFLRAIPVSVAGTLVDQISPGRVGKIAMNMRYLQKSGVPTVVGTASIALYSVVGVVTHLALLLGFSIWAGRVVDFSKFVPRPATLLVGAALLLGVVGILILVPRVRSFLREKVAPQGAVVRDSLAALMRQPVRLVLLVLGTVVSLMAIITALDLSVRAMGGSVALPVVAVLYLAGASVAGAAPVPGGLGAVEVVLIGGLTAAGVPSATAVPAVFLYRLATLWIPIMLGWASLTWLRRREYV